MKLKLARFRVLEASLCTVSWAGGMVGAETFRNRDLGPVGGSLTQPDLCSPGPILS